jgi:hypothetical protein
MLAGLRRRLGLVDVTTTRDFIVVEGISTILFFKDVYRIWGTSALYKHMFQNVRSSEFKMRHFFGFDFLYMCQTLYDDKQTRTPKRVLAKVIEELREKTWLGDVDRDVKSITDMSVVDNQVPFPLKPFQREFAQLYGRMVPAYKLKGYLLDAGAGTGKTVTSLVLSECLHAPKVIIFTPKNAAERVWKDTIQDIMMTKRRYWVSTEGRLPTLDEHFYVCHYESIQTIFDFVKANPRDFKDAMIIVDESHNFNRLAADRTQLLVEMCKMPTIAYCLWMSGTPIQAMGSECIPFLKCVDPYFDENCEEAFRKIYGKDAKRANDILRNRIGHLKYHVPKQDVVDTVVTVEQVMVKMPNGNDYTLEAIGARMRKFIDERKDYYEKNRKFYEDKYKEGLNEFEKTLRTDLDRREFNAYRSAFATVSGGFDPMTMKAEAQLCNRYELKTIMPKLNGSLKAEFKGARSVVKYVKLKIMGEALGGVLGKARSACHLDMLAHIDLEKYIDAAKKKTLIFTSYVEVLEAAADKLYHDGYTPAKVYGETNKDLPTIVAKYYKDEDLNPLVATFQSLSTAVPLTVANTILMLNQPFRDAIRTQTIARAARLGQDSEVFVFDFLLDTGDAPNISTRSNDILTWSAEMTASILGIKNVDTETLSLEVFDFMADLGSFVADLLGVFQGDLHRGGGEGWNSPSAAYSREVGDTIMSHSVQEEPEVDLPQYLYHGSAFKQGELLPGFQRSGEIVRWDKCETNEWLYAADEKDTAVMLGISSAIEKKFKLNRYKFEGRRIEIESHEPITIADIHALQVFLYTIKPDVKDGWMANYNPVNGLSGEFKTQSEVRKNILRCVPVDIKQALHGYSVQIKVIHSSFEGFGGLIDMVKKLFSSNNQKDEANKLNKEGSKYLDFSKVEAYLKQYFDNSTWLKDREFADTVSPAGIASKLAIGGKFDPARATSDIERNLIEFRTAIQKFNTALDPMDKEVDQAFEKHSKIVLGLINRKADDEEIEAACDAANQEADAIAAKCPLQKLIGQKWSFVGNEDVVVMKDEKGYFGVEAVGKRVPFEYSKQLPAIKAGEVQAVVKTIRECIKLANEKVRLNQGWLDFEDGSPIWNKLQDYNEPLYMDYFQPFYFQTASDPLGDSLPHHQLMAEDIIVALLTWLDRSIK